MTPSISVCIPTYGHFEYARRAAETCFQHTPGVHVMIVDDDSPVPGFPARPFWRTLPQERVHFHVFPENAGLTRSWNYSCERSKAEFHVCTNSDVVFSPGWYEPLVQALTEQQFHLVGPLSNAPGVTAKGMQEIQRYIKDFKNSDRDEVIAGTAAYLREHYTGQAFVHGINGFFMMARADDWRKYAFKGNPATAFDPSRTMTGNEDELQKRWRAAGAKIGIVPSSFIFHYRAVTRGSSYLHGLWARMKEKR